MRGGFYAEEVEVLDVVIGMVVVQFEGVDLKEEEVKQELLVIKEVSVAGIESTTRWTRGC